MSTSDFVGHLLGTSLSDVLNDAVKEVSEDLKKQRAKKKSAQNAEKLKIARESLAVHHTFASGDLIQWKKGLRNLSVIGPFDIIEIMETPFVSRDYSAISQFAEPMTIIALFIDGDGDASRILLNPDRMEPYTPEVEEPTSTEKVDPEN